MADYEKVVKGLEACVDGGCIECPYRKVCSDAEDFVALARDALKLLKPRVLTLEEVEDALDTIVWVDRPQVENSSDEYALISSYSHKLGYVDLKFIDEGWGRFTYAWYGKTWRCWDKRPYDEERKAAKWDA